MKTLIIENEKEIYNHLLNNNIYIANDIDLATTSDEIIDYIYNFNYDVILFQDEFIGFSIWKLPLMLKCDNFNNKSCQIILVKEYTNINDNSMALSFGIYISTLSGINKFYITNKFIKYSLLIIEDDEDALDIAYNVLKNDFYIEKAVDGNEGLELWKNNKHDIVLLDYMLPDVTGDHILEKIIAIDENQPIIIVSAFDNDHNHKMMFKKGTCDFISKPYSIEKLRQKCYEVLKQTRLAQDTLKYSELMQVINDHIWVIDYLLGQNNILQAQELIKELSNKINLHMPSEDDLVGLVNTNKN